MPFPKNGESVSPALRGAWRLMSRNHAQSSRLAIEQKVTKPMPSHILMHAWPYGQLFISWIAENLGFLDFSILSRHRHTFAISPIYNRNVLRQHQHFTTNSCIMDIYYSARVFIDLLSFHAAIRKEKDKNHIDYTPQPGLSYGTAFSLMPAFKA